MTDLTIRSLTTSDEIAYQAMDNGLAHDYMLSIFSDLVSSKTGELYGLFQDNHTLLATAGYTLHKDHAMIGRLRTAVPARGKGYAKTILRFALEGALAHPDVRWVGAYTAKNNVASQAVLNSIGLQPLVTLSTHLIRPDRIPLLQQQMTWTKSGTPFLNFTEASTTLTTEAYYPYPYNDSHVINHYLAEALCYTHTPSGKYVFFSFDEKDDSFLLMNTPCPSVLQDPDLWTLAMQLAKDHSRVLRFDAEWPLSESIPLSTEMYTVEEPWMVFEVSPFVLEGLNR
ncbi:GNAT family N-acetyltransferase [Aureibacillus halotolerans]|uniref:Acetyltransferase (GNAT) family protein n=1 Tax=Aureibacillus halotolerans TaxID=1508390 RepID=A0A4R6U4K1_9BACI|nr:GNAT family N-acetyltransferase [Aureibacillus halotolerans]TDQ40422.1 acetyltransferase (GNAT) family protein [Aureibacillus halotolerans]